MSNAQKSVLNEERRQAILDSIQRNGRAFVRELAASSGTSEVTIRRDLALLQKRGLVLRTHGGVLPARAMLQTDFNLAERALNHPKEKVAIAQAAAAMVKNGQSIILGSGSTTAAIARELAGFKNLTVITNSISIAAELASGDVDVLLTGGMLRKTSRSLIGPLAELAFSQLGADIFFMGTDGIDSRRGLCTQNLLGAPLVRRMAEVAARTVVVCDSSKFATSSLYAVIPISKVQGVITDSRIPQDELTALRAAGVEVTLV
ncbi:MAG: DeoR/GlpR family DNA-binding transcription regulator [Candidatus Acidiferrum sp.]|jgi:DeoR family transcriptional regulator of aga operon